MMKITRKVILDLLPMYLADEVSADTRALIEEYLKTDSELANVAKHASEMKLQEDIPVPLSQDNKMNAYKKAKRIIILHTIILAGIISVVLVITIFAFFFSSP